MICVCRSSCVVYHPPQLKPVNVPIISTTFPSPPQLSSYQRMNPQALAEKSLTEIGARNFTALIFNMSQSNFHKILVEQIQIPNKYILKSLPQTLNRVIECRYRMQVYQRNRSARFRKLYALGGGYDWLPEDRFPRLCGKCMQIKVPEFHFISHFCRFGWEIKVWVIGPFFPPVRCLCIPLCRGSRIVRCR